MSASPTTQNIPQSENEMVIAANWITRYKAIIKLFWIASTLMFTGFLVVALPDMYQLWSSYCNYPVGCFNLTSEQGAALARIGISMPAWAWFMCSFAIVLSIALTILSAIFVWSKVDKLVVLLIGFTALGLGYSTTGVAQVLAMKYPDLHLPLILILIVYFVIGVSFIFYLVPNGRPQPGWIIWLIPLDLVNNLYQLFLAQDSKGTFLEPIFQVINFISIIGVFLLLILRYFRYSNLLEKRQIKIIFYSRVIFYFFQYVVNSYLPQLFPLLQKPDSYYFILQMVSFLFACTLAWSGLALALFRARFLDIDIIVKRTLVYTALSTLIVATYLLSVFVLQIIVSAVTEQQNDLVLIGATLVSLALFQPLRKAIQGFVDRRFYRRKYDAARTVANFSSQLQSETDLKTLTEQLKGVLSETLQPEQVAIWIKKNPETKKS